MEAYSNREGIIHPSIITIHQSTEKMLTPNHKLYDEKASIIQMTFGKFLIKK